MQQTWKKCLKSIQNCMIHCGNIWKKFNSIHSDLGNKCKPMNQSANRSSQIVTGGKVRAAKRLTRKSHTCSMGLRSEIVPANPYVQYPHS
ncbi:hypothetical protein TNCV_3899821 [Trichonephila clavipes]|nr:hypothetical protein TNCV_3899821 [Trichonephila clavipes]